MHALSPAYRTINNLDTTHMFEIGPEHPLTYRQEIAAPLFKAIRDGDSCAIVGSSSVGKSRFWHFLRQPDVVQHYLGDQADKTLLVAADSNRLAEMSEWGLYELLLTTIIETIGAVPELRPVRPELNELRREVINSKNALLARRQVELTTRILCTEQGQKVCFLLDEFDEVYRTMTPLALANLRALRDMNKYRLCYIPLLRDHPARLRSIHDSEGFYELFSHSIIGLGPYSHADADRMLMQLQVRKNRTISPPVRDDILQISGGHAGLITALFEIAIKDRAGKLPNEAERLLSEPVILEECQKLWASLTEDEHLALIHLARGVAIADGSIDRVLKLKGFIQTKEEAAWLFSPLFECFLMTKASLADSKLHLDPETRSVWVGAREIKGLTAREFDLVASLYRCEGKVCSRDEILSDLYPDEVHTGDVQDNRVDSLIRHARKKIEPAPKRPCYLLTVRQKGYRLVTVPEST